METAPLSSASTEAVITQIRVEYTEEDPEIYIMPLSFATGERAAANFRNISKRRTRGLTVRDKTEEKSGCLYDAVIDKEFCKALIQMIVRRRRLRGAEGEFVAAPTRALKENRTGSIATLEVSSMRAEQSNSSMVFGDQLILKLFRRTQPGINPDLEIGYFLTERAAFSHTPAVAGTIEYRPAEATVSLSEYCRSFVPNEGDAWRHTLDALSQYFERAVTRPSG